jgi:hypothetical protein
MTRFFGAALMIGLIMVGLALLIAPAHAASCFLYTENVGHVCTAEATQPQFVAPEPFPDSFLPRRSYARVLHDSVIYSAPSTSAPVVRALGYSFYYATVQGAVESEGELWYMIAYGQYVQASNIQLVNDSEFTGVELTRQPERPFGWMLVDFQPSRAPGADPIPGTPRLTRYTFFQVYDAVEAADGWIWYNIGGGYWMRQTYVSLVELSARPEEIGEDEYWVEIDLYEQSFAAYEGDRMVYAGLVSSGLNRWPTNEGLFQVWSRHSETKMSGADGRIDEYYVQDVPHTMFFDNDIALHGAYWHDRFGYKHSHGCVNMPPRDAEWVYNWSANAPSDLWVWVHTSDPTHYFERYDPAGPLNGP